MPKSQSRREVLSAEVKPQAPATVLIGTLETLTGLANQLRAVPGCVEPVGCLVVGESLPGVATIATEGADGHGIAVLGTLDELARVRDRLRVKAAVVCLPSSMPTVAAETRRRLADLGVEERFVPPLREVFAPGANQAGWWRPSRGAIDPAVLIGREPHRLDRAAVSRVLRGKRVLITGAGGSIGSELAKIAAEFGPELLVLMERSENALFEVDRQLGSAGVPRKAVLHDVVDAAGTRRLLAQHQPHVVFHAAAHKHVPLMEDHPAHAVTNNVFGTKSVADAAAAAGCERFVLISTDKAVHPTSVMGATKRVAEQYVRWLHREERIGRGRATTFSVVRFGNVLGSACSVLPIWAAQLADGGPLTVTDPRMTRYFMTIPEAATLVVQAAALSGEAPEDSRHDANLFVLDMGTPVRILDLAERFVRLHGLEPVSRGAPSGERPAGSGSIEIVFTGVRPGEKLDEELTYAAERLRPTRHTGIRALDASGDPLPNVPALMSELDEVRRDADHAAVVAALRSGVPELDAAPLRRAG